MARIITLTLGPGLGSDLGPNFNLTTNVGVVTPSGATKTELLLGKVVSVEDTATEVTITSTGDCTTAITQEIVCDAVLSFVSYDIGVFYFTITPAIGTTLTIIDCGVTGYISGGVTCGDSNGTDFMSTSAVISAGETFTSVNGQSALGCTSEWYRQADNIRVNGSPILLDGDTITIGGVLITININNTSVCAPYICE